MKNKFSILGKFCFSVQKAEIPHCGTAKRSAGIYGKGRGALWFLSR